MAGEPKQVGWEVDRARVMLWAILLAAGLLRLGRLDLMAFEMDEGAACILAVRLTHYGLPPLVGVKTSFHFYNSPLFIYVIAPAFLVTTDARFAALVFALLGVAAVYVVYRAGREFFSTAVGLLAAALMALSPAAVDYSRRLWGHSLIQVICPVVFYLALRWTVGGKPKAVFWLALLVGAAQQFHFSGALMWLSLLVAWIVFRPKTDWLGAALGLALAALGYLPFMIEQFDTGFADLGIMARLVARGADVAPVPAAKLLAYWFFATTDLGHNNFLQHEYGAFLSGIQLYRTTRLMLGLLWLGALIGCAWKSALRSRGECSGHGSAGRPAARETLLLIWSLLPLVVFLVLRVPVVAPYFLVVYPAPFLATAWAATVLWQRPQSWQPRAWPRLAIRVALVAVLLAWVAEQVAFHVALRRKLDHDGGGVGTYASFGSQQAAMRFIAYHAPGRKVVVSEEQLDPARRGIGFRYWFLLWTFDRDMERFFPPERNEADYWYVIHNTHYQLRPNFEAFLRRVGSRWRDFGFLRVYVVSRPGPWPRFVP